MILRLGCDAVKDGGLDLRWLRCLSLWAVNLLRHKLGVALFFVLISLGQAYPYSVTFNLTEAHQCGCNLRGRECVHGCDLSHRHGGHHGVMAKGHDHHQHGAEPAAANHSIAKKTTPPAQWVAPRCSETAQRKLLSLQGDPFLLNRVTVLFPVPWTQNFEPYLPAFQERVLSVEAPPPRHG